MGTQLNRLSPGDLAWLQGEQCRHEAIAHADIDRLPMRRQLVNFTLHLSKYQGRLLKALRSQDAEAVQRIVTDSFIILLAAANTLGKSPKIFSADRVAPLSHLRGPDALMSAYIEVVGEMSRACEAFDDDENFPSHGMLHTCVSTLCRVVISLADVNGVPLLETVPHRWGQVERRAAGSSAAGRIANVA